MRGWMVGCLAVVLAGAVLTAEEKGTKYGAGVALTTATPIAQLAASPDQFVGKTIRVDGTVTAVCEHQGCWMVLKDAASDATVRIKVDDGVIVFPMTAKGKKASAEGVFEKIDVKPEAAHHEAMDTEKKDEPKKDVPAAHADQPAATHQLKATGALVY